MIRSANWTTTWHNWERSGVSELLGCFLLDLSIIRQEQLQALFGLHVDVDRVVVALKSIARHRHKSTGMGIDDRHRGN